MPQRAGRRLAERQPRPQSAPAAPSREPAQKRSEGQVCRYEHGKVASMHSEEVQMQHGITWSPWLVLLETRYYRYSRERKE
eukprot:6210157-Pleurochrysis_carterae.AAC.2